MFQLNDFRLGIIFFKVEDIADICPPEQVDRLIIVADNADIAMALGQQVHPAILSMVCVLVFIYMYVLKAVLVIVEDLGLRVSKSSTCFTSKSSNPGRYWPAVWHYII